MRTISRSHTNHLVLLQKSYFFSKYENIENYSIPCFFAQAYKFVTGRMFFAFFALQSSPPKALKPPFTPLTLPTL
jgi:hypothetical protein